MQRLEVSGAVRPIYGSLGVKRIIIIIISIVRVQIARGSVSSEPMRCSQGPVHIWRRILLKYVTAVRTCVVQAVLYYLLTVFFVNSCSLLVI